MANKKAKGTMGSVPPPLATRSTRSRAKAVDPVDTESAGPAEDPARTNARQKRKRAMTNVSEQGRNAATKKKPHVTNSPDAIDDEASNEEAEDIVTHRASRIAPARPKLKVPVGSDNESEAQESGESSSDGELENLTAKQINAERPVPVQNRKPGNIANTRDAAIENASDARKVGRRAKKVLDEIPLVVQPQLPTEHDDQDIDALGTLPLTVMPVVPAFFPTPAADPPTLADPAPAPAAVLLPQPGNNWLGATNLVARDDGRLLQTGQSREINRYISKAVRLMNLKIFFVDAFPDLETQNNWLSECLVTALKDQAQTDNVAREVNLRAQQDHQYMSGLISMMANRWCGARQMVIDAARDVIVSKECTYGIEGLDKQAKVAKVAKLLDEEAFHFKKTSSGARNKGAPYQDPEIASCISQFFKGRSSYGAEYAPKLSRGKNYGLLMPPAMVALVATAMEVALKEWKTGTQVKRAFTETDHGGTYRDHLAAMQMVKGLEEGESTKYERMLSTIYTQTMNCANRAKSAPATVTSAPKKLVIDLDAMEE